MRSGRRAAKLIALVTFIIVILVATPQAQQPVAFSGSSAGISGGPAAMAPDATAIDLLVGRSTILNVGGAIARVSLTVPDIADAMVTAPQQLLIHGKTPGTISLFVWDRAGAIKTYEVTVRRDLSRLVEQVKDLFPGEPITVTGSGKEVVLSGLVTSKYVHDKAAEVASGYVEKPEYVVNLLKQQEGVASNQVMLRVRFAEVSRSALQELGVNFIVNGYKGEWYGRTTTQQFAAPDFDSDRPGGLTFSDFLNVFLFNAKHDIGAVVKALSSKGLFQSLAEPNLISLNGKEASFLAGGEYPYPVVQPGTGGNAVTIMFKEFGVRLKFTPTVLNNDLINLKITPEVSSLDFSNGIVLSGFRVPALSTRRTDTEVELQNGQTFAIAGLLNNTLNSTMQKIPGIGDIPILGYLFRSRAYQKNQSELVVMVTPTVVRRGSVGVSSGLPAIVEPYLSAPKQTMPQPPAYVGSPIYPPAGARPGGGAQQPQPEPQAAAQPANVQAPAAVKTATPAPAAPAQATQSAPSATMPRTTVPEQQPVVTQQAPRAAVPAAAQTMTPAPQPSAAAPPKPDLKAEARALEEAKRAAEAQKAADRKTSEDQAVADRKAAQSDKKAAEAQAEAARKKLEEQERQAKLDKERAKREAEVAKKNAESDRKKQEESKKHEKAIAEAAARLREAQAAYQAQVEKKKGQ
jgi:pilus assembly protein CpaC